jgi:transposase-like protein
MASQNGSGKDRRRRRLTVQDKYQVWLEVIAREASQRDIADRWGVDRSTVIKIAQVGKQAALDGLARSAPGRPGKSPAERELEAARAFTTTWSGCTPASATSHPTTNTPDAPTRSESRDVKGSFVPGRNVPLAI